LHEDFSATGGSTNLGAYNDQIAAAYYAQTHQNWGANADTWASVNSWLPTFIAQQQTSLRQIANVTAAMGARPAVTAPITVNPPATMDYELLADIVARKIFLRGR
jgi:hypothetical protein